MKPSTLAQRGSEAARGRRHLSYDSRRLRSNVLSSARGGRFSTIYAESSSIDSAVVEIKPGSFWRKQCRNRKNQCNWKREIRIENKIETELPAELEFKSEIGSELVSMRKSNRLPKFNRLAASRICECERDVHTEGSREGRIARRRRGAGELEGVGAAPGGVAPPSRLSESVPTSPVVRRRPYGDLNDCGGRTYGEIYGNRRVSGQTSGRGGMRSTYQRRGGSGAGGRTLTARHSRAARARARRRRPPYVQYVQTPKAKWTYLEGGGWHGARSLLNEAGGSGGGARAGAPARVAPARPSRAPRPRRRQLSP
ncbi:hypothetical protein EVAR_3195_1 [Eumeta japonica]|uniref:Uncharacterized protein n=1 Tax=Eumeta variegata TaxID=151549 RepID=A0A4C1SXB6_EUMVA|nr:hypothetical protein EVAR_3195_1 [Eumeta japonica]